MAQMLKSQYEYARDHLLQAKKEEEGSQDP
jgi:hypothetical protein